MKLRNPTVQVAEGNEEGDDDDRTRYRMSGSIISCFLAAGDQPVARRYMPSMPRTSPKQTLKTSPGRVFEVSRAMEYGGGGDTGGR